MTAKVDCFFVIFSFPLNFAGGFVTAHVEVVSPPPLGPPMDMHVAVSLLREASECVPVGQKRVAAFRSEMVQIFSKNNNIINK